MKWKKVNIKDNFDSNLIDGEIAQPFAFFSMYDGSVIWVNLEREVFYPLQTASAK